MMVQTEIGSLGSTFTGLIGKTKVDFGHGDALYITFLNVLSNPIIDSTIFEKVDVKSSEKQNLCKKGDLFFNTSSETIDEVGLCSYLNIDVERLYLNSFCFGFRIKDQTIVDGKYLAYYFRGKEGRQLMTMLAQGSTRYNLSKDFFLKSTIEIPSLTEQQNIASALSSIDKLINDLERTIHKKQLIREGAMEELLSGKKRLPGFTDEWVEKEIGKIGKTYSGLSGKRKEDFGHGNAKYITFLNVLNNAILDISIFEPVDVKLTEKQNATHYGDLFFNTSSETPEEVGICACLNAEIPNLYLNSFCFGYRLSDPEVYGNFLAYFFRTKRGREVMCTLAQGATRYNLSKEYFNDIKILMPSTIKEQREISYLLEAMDDEISVLQIEKTKYEQIRSGMMEELLTGKKRLK